MVTGHGAPATSVTREDVSPGVEALTLDNGAVAVTVWDLGATIASVLAPDQDGVRGRVVVPPRQPGDAGVEPPAFIGSTLGRYARIIAEGRTQILGESLRLTLNAGGHHIHGGPGGLDTRTWSTAVEQSENGLCIVLAVHSPDGDQGYPGAVEVRARFELDTSHTLTVTYTATTDRPTLVGLAPHAFWNLAGHGRVDDHLLRSELSLEVVSGPDFVPTGALANLAGGPRDFATLRAIGAAEIDHCWVRPPTDDGELVELALLVDPSSGRRLRVSSDQSAMAVYTGDHLPDSARAGLCLQPGPWPDAPNHPGFASAVLLPHETYRHRCRFDLTATDRYLEGEP